MIYTCVCLLTNDNLLSSTVCTLRKGAGLMIIQPRCVAWQRYAALCYVVAYGTEKTLTISCVRLFVDQESNIPTTVCTFSRLEIKLLQECELGTPATLDHPSCCSLSWFF